ncbi:hypothetical protein Clacol_001303 [Clathrus columnatus]|uniref:Uncharacterized protein n=1 Tax=Clathrus columnatus TaxID=1419009 RepID=A0AAV5A1K1_9AGAM|nr:hypothetical protein Clacol_001303 [Clathrus columnatus]
MSEITSENHKRFKKRHRHEDGDDSQETEKRSKKKHKKDRAKEDKTQNGEVDDVVPSDSADVVKLVEDSPEVDKEHKKKKKKKDKHKDNQENQGMGDAAGAATEPQAEKKKEKKKKDKHKHKHKHRDENHEEKENEENETNDNVNSQNESHLQTMIDLEGSSSEDILRAFQQLDLAHLQGVLGSLDLPSMGIDLTLDKSMNTNPTSNKTSSKSPKNKSSTDAEPSKKVKRKRVVDLKNLVNPNAGNSQATMLATKWMSSKELKQLEETQGLVFKKGKFSFTEDHALKTAIEQHRTRSGLSEQQMVDFINSKRTPEHGRFWTDVALAVPGRPVQAVYHHVKRTYNPLGCQGKWIPEEDAALRRAVADLGFSWTKVSQHIGRTPADCRDRWRNHVGISNKYGKWSLEEEEELTNIIKSFTIDKGKDLDSEVFWKAVSDKMEGRRSREQCRNKWRDDLRARTMGADGKRRWSQSDNYTLIHQMAVLSVNDDSEIVWKDLRDSNENLKFYSHHNLQKQWKRLEASVPNYENMAYKDILKILLGGCGQLPTGSTAKKELKKGSKKETKKKKFPQPPEPKSAEMIEDSDEDNTSNDDEPEDQQTGVQKNGGGNQEDNDSSLKPTDSTSEDESEIEEDDEEED